MSLAGFGTAFGFRPSLSYLVGIITGTTVVLLMITTGVTALVLAQPILLTALTILAGIYILYLAWKIATAPVGPLAPRSVHALSIRARLQSGYCESEGLCRDRCSLCGSHPRRG